MNCSSVGLQTISYKLNCISLTRCCQYWPLHDILFLGYNKFNSYCQECEILPVGVQFCLHLSFDWCQYNGFTTTDFDFSIQNTKEVQHKKLNTVQQI